MDTTYRYVNADSDTVSRAREAFDAYHREQDELAQKRVESAIDVEAAENESVM